MFNACRLALFSICVPAIALGADQNPASQASPDQIRAWRAAGPAAVDRLMAERAKLIADAESVPGKESYTLTNDYVVQNEAQRAAWQRVYAINETIDAVAGAKYSHESGLYWYTDEATAFRVASQQRKPVLSLRLLGNLNEELSCANSRYFRILLYPDESVRKLLHDRFVLTWKSVRPVPKITVDFGDGRKVERTITGNSVHYVLLSDGTVVDVFPGLYGPKPFVMRLEQAAAAADRTLLSREPLSREPQAVLRRYRDEQLADLKRRWDADWERYQKLQSQPLQLEKNHGVGYAPSSPKDFWTTIADYHPDFAELGKASRDLIKHEAMVGYYGTSAEHVVATRHGERIIPVLAFVKGGDEAIMSRLLACATLALQADTLANEYRGRYSALQRLNHPPAVTADSLNHWVYLTVFGYDPRDPWAGLSQLASLTALPKDRGLMESQDDPLAKSTLAPTAK